VRNGSRPPVGSLEWESDGGPPLSLSQRLGLLTGMAVVLLGHAGPRLRSSLARHGVFGGRPPRRIDLARMRATTDRGGP